MSFRPQPYPAASGAKLNRPGLTEALNFVRAGDTLVIWKLDRLGRSIGGLIELAADLSARKIDFRSLTDGFDTATPSGRLLFHILASVAEMERELIKERTIAGLATARAKGGTGGGRKSVMTPDMLDTARKLLKAGDKPAKVAKLLQVGRSTFYRHFPAAERARQRSVFALYQVVTQGIDGTGMQSFADVANDQRWALAFRAGSFAFTDEQAREGERLWKSNPALRQRIPDLKTLVALTPAALATSIGEAKADAVMAYLRRHPDQVMQHAPGSLAVARAKLAQSLAAARRGDARGARELALSAYLDGFEPVEPTLTARDAALMGRIEGAMGEFRAAIDRGASPNELAEKVSVLDGLFDDAEAALAPDAATEASTFLGAFTILLREGLEALLIVVAMIAFLRKAERGEALRYVHGGWISALVAGGITWVVATYAIGISGASRELTEGFGSLFAAVVLLSVGIWMHGKAQADQWQRYIREKMSRALTGGSGWFLFGLAFVVVYREVFETILFYAALWSQGNGPVLLAGAGSAVLLLAVIAWAMLRYSRTLPITQFFRYSSWLMAILTVVLAGKGVSALQEAGIIAIAPLRDVPRLSILGLFPTWQSVLAQLLMAVAIAIGFAWNRRGDRGRASAH